MKTPGSVALLMLFWLCLLGQAWANIYVFTAEDGTVSLSNVPVDRRYKVMLPAAGEPEKNVAGNASANLANKARFDKIISEVADTYGVDEALLHAVITVESRYSPNAVSRKGAAGLMQLMPETARRYGVADSLDPVQNLHGGTRYLRDLLKLFDSDVSLALAAYNAGESAVIRHGRRIPPYRETASYVPRVLALYRQYQVQPL
jgi:soluble lytic murein transglycosylase-like protein